MLEGSTRWEGLDILSLVWGLRDHTRRNVMVLRSWERGLQPLASGWQMGPRSYKYKKWSSTKAWMTLEVDSSSETPGRKEARLTQVFRSAGLKKRTSHTIRVFGPAQPWTQELHVALSHCSFDDLLHSSRQQLFHFHRDRDSKETATKRQTDTANGAKSTVSNPWTEIKGVRVLYVMRNFSANLKIQSEQVKHN